MRWLWWRLPLLLAFEATKTTEEHIHPRKCQKTQFHKGPDGPALMSLEISHGIATHISCTYTSRG